MTYRTIGRCSLCGGDVTVFSGAWGSIIPPVPRCSKCGARPQTTLPVIPMELPYKLLDNSFPYYISTIFEELEKIENEKTDKDPD